MAYPNPTFQTAQILTTPPLSDSSNNAANTAFVNGALDNLMGRNVIVDGNFDSSSLATFTSLPTTGSSYTDATMYRATAGTGGVSTSANGSFAIGAAPVGMESHALNYLTINQTTASTGTVVAGTAPALFQYVENVSTFQGQSSTYSVWLWTTSGTATISNVYAGQYFGPGTNASATVALTVPVTWNLTTTPQRFSVRIDWPSIAGKSLGTGGNSFYPYSQIQIGLWLPTGSTFSINTTQWQLERALPTAPATGNPSAFEYRGVQAESARISRYYESFIYSGSTGYAFAATSTTVYASISYSPKHSIGSAISLTSGSFTFNNASNTYAVTALSTYESSVNQAVLILTVSGSPVANTPGVLVTTGGTITIDCRP